LIAVWDGHVVSLDKRMWAETLMLLAVLALVAVVIGWLLKK
jgi:hypothetical protein